MNAGNGFKPLKVPSTATLFKLRTAIAIKYNNTKQNIRNITISFKSALNLSFILSPQLITLYNRKRKFSLII